ncbi:MAG: L-threonylcarbamoyladenylate synthase [Candidatus Eremiobacteraeota bacterium]|nr:L-threonylcarbamoyladenylate synthase [Candidatus Eremiobacteraeota bacterium]
MSVQAVIDARTERIEHVVEECARIVFSGGTIVFPNDASYGLACDPHRSEAIDRIYHAKGHPDHKPLTLYVATPAEFLEYARGNSIAPLAAKRLLPGPVTLVVRKPGFISEELTAGMPTLGLRVPDDAIAHAILERCGPLAVSRANLNGRPQYRGNGNLENLATCDLLIEGGPPLYELESSIVDLTVSPPRLLRAGAMSFERLSELLGPLERHTIKVRTQS